MKVELHKYFDFKIGLIGALVMGIAVFCINYFATYLVIESLTASFKQAVYTFFLGGFFMKSCEYIATHIRNYGMAIVLAVCIPSIITLILTFGLHVFKGTPKPLASTIPTLAIIPATFVWAIRKRKLLKFEAKV
jgi:hypothetical protein